MTIDAIDPQVERLLYRLLDNTARDYDEDDEADFPGIERALQMGLVKRRLVKFVTNQGPSYKVTKKGMWALGLVR